MSDRDKLVERISQALTDHSELTRDGNGWECEGCGYWMAYPSTLTLHQADVATGLLVSPLEADPEVKVDHEAGAVYVQITHDNVHETTGLDYAGVSLDRDEHGRVVGIEVLRATPPEPDPETVDRAAKAIFDYWHKWRFWGEISPVIREEYRDMARAAFRAMRGDTDE